MDDAVHEAQKLSDQGICMQIWNSSHDMELRRCSVKYFLVTPGMGTWDKLANKATAVVHARHLVSHDQFHFQW